MNFNLTEEQTAFCHLAKQFAEQSLAPHAAEWDQNAFFPVDTIKEAARLGFCSLYSHESIGGLGLSRLDASLVFEQLSMGCTATTAYLTIHNMVTWMVGAFAHDELKSSWGPLLAAGEKLASYCLTEPGAGSDAASLKTRAELKGDAYILNGSKMFISGAGSTDLLLVMARTGGAGAKGISAFAVPAESKGISYGRKEEKMGWNCQPTRLISFDNVRIPATHRLGQEGEGFRFAMKGLDGGRINIAAAQWGRRNRR